MIAIAPNTLHHAAICWGAKFAPHLALEEGGELGDGQRRPVAPAPEQALKDDLVELAVRAPDEETKKLRGGGKGVSGFAPSPMGLSEW